ncbi:MAG: hypothetical protein IK133_02335, partial [Clostridia bacterium]|nr:hypothetical protein [Clostridia bacterium]
MSNLHRMAALLTLLLVIGAASSAENLLPISVLDNNGQAAEMTEFVADGDNAWWAELPEDSSFDNLVLMIEGDDPSGFFPASGSVVSIPDAGEMIENAGYIVIAQYDDDGTEKERMRLYASHAPYAPVQEKSYRSMRAAGQWGRINGTAILKTDPETADEEAGRLDAGTRVFVLFTCQVKNKEYACIRFAEDTFYIARNNVRFLTDTANVSFEAQFLRENEMSEEYRIVKTMYNAKIRDTIGTSSDAVVETAPLNTILLVLAQVSWDNRLYDLVYRFDNGVIGFVHDSQMKDLSEEESAEALAGTDEDTAAFAGTV